MKEARSSRVVIIGLALIAIALGVIVWSIARGPSGPAPAEQGAQRDRATVEAAARARAARVAAPQGTLRLEGQVVDAAERPIGGATVTLFTTEPRTVVSEDDGSFAFEGVPSSTLRVEAHRGADRAGATVRVRADTEPVILRMRRGNTVAVTVVDEETGQPIAGAMVDAARVKAKTDDKGVALLEGLPSGSTGIVASADGHAPESRFARLPDDPDGKLDVTIPLPSAAEISGTAVGPDGAPVPDASVTVEPAEMKGSFGAPPTFVSTDANGAWMVWCARGEYQISAGSNVLEESAPISVVSDGATAQSGIVLQLTAGAAISGHVVDGDGNPVAGARVWLRDGSGRAQVDAGSDGAFVIPGLPADAHPTVWAIAGDLSSDNVTVAVGSDEATHIELVALDATIRGTVVDASGAPVAEAQVSASRRAGGPVETITDEAGQFVVGPLVQGDWDVEASWPGADTEDRMRHRGDTPVHAHTGDTDVTITMPATGSITGVVIRDGAPVAAYAVVVGSSEPMLIAETPTIVRSTDGRFTRDRVPVGTRAVAVVGDGFARKVIDSVEVKAGAVTDLGTIQVDGGRTISGRVLDTDGQPVARAEVDVAPYLVAPSNDRRVEHPLVTRLQERYTATSDGNGRFTVPGVAVSDRPLRAIAHANGARSEEVDVPDAGELELVVQAVGKIAGTIDGARDFTMVEATSVGNPNGQNAVGVHGKFEIEDLVPGRYQVTAMDKDFHHSNVVDVDVRAGETANVALAFTASGITVAVHLGTKQCRMVTLMKSDTTTSSPFQSLGGMARCTGADTTLTQVQPGDYQLCVDSDCKPLTVTPTPAQQAIDVSSW